MNCWKRIVIVALCAGCLLSLAGCGKRANLMAGRLYYTVSEVGCTRIEWTDIDGKASHHVLGTLPVRDEFSDQNVNADDDVTLARESKYVYAPAVSDDGKYMACLYGKKKPSICLFNLETGMQEGTITGNGELNHVAMGADNHEVLYSRYTDNKRIHLMRQVYPSSPKEFVTTRGISGMAYSYVDSSIYYSDVYPDGYTVLKRYDAKNDKSIDVLEGAEKPAFPRLGHELLCILDGRLTSYNIITKEKLIITEEPGITSPCWDPQSKYMAYVKNGAIFIVKPGEDPKQLVLANKNVLDVCWAKGLD